MPITAEQREKIIQYYKKEKQKCEEDAVYFAKNYCMIVTPDDGKIPFKMFDFQEKCIKDFQENRYNVVLKARQLGLSTTVAMYALHTMLFKDAARVAIIANKQKTAKELLDKVKVMWEALPTWLGGPKAGDKNYDRYCKVYNKYEFKMNNDSLIEAFSSGSNSTRSISSGLLILDEFAFVQDAEGVKGGALSTVTSSNTGRCIMLSTPGPSNGGFYDTWTEANEGQGAFHPIELRWDVHPHHGPEWRAEQDRIFSKKQAARENDLLFDSTGDTVFDSDDILYLEKHFVVAPIEKRGPLKDFWIWDYAIPGHSYFSIVDCATGDASDFSTISIIDSNTFDLVAEYMGLLKPVDLAKMAVYTGKEYNDSLLVIERTGEAGGATVAELSHLEYPNVFKMPSDASTTDFETFLKTADMAEEDMKVGVSNNVRTRPVFMSKFTSYVAMMCNPEIPNHSKPNIIKSTRLIKEFRSFIWKNSKAQAAKGQHDDLIIPRAIACGLQETAFNYQQKLNTLFKATIDNIKVYRPFAKYNLPGPYGKPASNPYQMQHGSVTEDMSWLLDR